MSSKQGFIGLDYPERKIFRGIGLFLTETSRAEARQKVETAMRERHGRLPEEQEIIRACLVQFVETCAQLPETPEEAAEHIRAGNTEMAENLRRMNAAAVAFLSYTEECFVVVHVQNVHDLAPPPPPGMELVASYRLRVTKIAARTSDEAARKFAKAGPDGAGGRAQFLTREEKKAVAAYSVPLTEQ